MHGLVWLICFSSWFVSSFYCVCPLGLLSLCPYGNLFTCNFACISYSCKVCVYLYLHVVILSTIDIKNCSFTLYSPIKFLIIVFFCSYFSLFIHSSTFSLLCLVSLQNWRDFNVSGHSSYFNCMTACLPSKFVKTLMFSALPIF